jgi:hypothetical protein
VSCWCVGRTWTTSASLATSIPTKRGSFFSIGVICYCKGSYIKTTSLLMRARAQATVRIENE